MEDDERLAAHYESLGDGGGTVVGVKKEMGVKQELGVKQEPGVEQGPGSKQDSWVPEPGVEDEEGEMEEMEDVGMESKPTVHGGRTVMGG